MAGVKKERFRLYRADGESLAAFQKRKMDYVGYQCKILNQVFTALHYLHGKVLTLAKKKSYAHITELTRPVVVTDDLEQHKLEVDENGKLNMTVSGTDIKVTRAYINHLEARFAKTLATMPYMIRSIKTAKADPNNVIQKKKRQMASLSGRFSLVVVGDYMKALLEENFGNQFATLFPSLVKYGVSSKETLRLALANIFGGMNGNEVYELINGQEYTSDNGVILPLFKRVRSGKKYFYEANDKQTMGELLGTYLRTVSEGKKPSKLILSILIISGACYSSGKFDVLYGENDSPVLQNILSNSYKTKERMNLALEELRNFSNK